MFLLLSLPLTLTLSEYSLNKDIVLGGFCLGFVFFCYTTQHAGS